MSQCPCFSDTNEASSPIKSRLCQGDYEAEGPPGIAATTLLEFSPSPVRRDPEIGLQTGTRFRHKCFDRFGGVALGPPFNPFCRIGRYATQATQHRPNKRYMLQGKRYNL